MADMLMLAQMGLKLAGGLSDYQSQAISSNANKAYQAYRNTMLKLSGAQEKNAITLNEIAVRDASLSEDTDLQLQSLRDRAAAKVSAGAAGVKGISVDLVMRDLATSAARASKNRVDNLKAQFAASEQQRRNVNVSMVTGKDISIIPRPSISSLLLGSAEGALEIWDSHQPPEASGPPKGVIS